MDHGSEFRAEVESTLREHYGIRIKRITTRNPQANAMVERAHLTIKNMIATQKIFKKADLPNGSWKGILGAVGFGMRTTVHTTMRATPMQLVFNRDAIHNVRFEANWRRDASASFATTTNEKTQSARRTPTR
jgi:transposase InsO family protein